MRTQVRAGLVTLISVMVSMIFSTIAYSANVGSGRTLDVRCAGVGFHIPRAYLIGRIPDQDQGESGSFSVAWLLALPGLRPMAPDTAATLNSTNALDKLRAVFTCGDNSAMTPALTRIKEILENSGLREDQYTTLTGGLQLYSDKQPGFAAELYVQPATDGTPTLFMQCPTDGLVPYPICTVIERLDERAKIGFFLTYWFDKRYKLQFPEIDKALRGRLASMRTN